MNADDLGVLRDARREIANAALNTEDSFQRLISEHRGSPEALEPVMALIVLTRRIAASTASLAIAAKNGAHARTEAIAPFERASNEVLSDLSDALLAGRAPAPFPAPGKIVLPDAASAPVLHQKLTRLARQLKLMHDAVARWMQAQSR